MNLFAINHHPQASMDGDAENNQCKQCALRKHRPDLPAVKNWINLDNLTEVSWEDKMWLVHFGDIYYRVHDKAKMKALEEALWPAETKTEPLEVRVVAP